MFKKYILIIFSILATSCTKYDIADVFFIDDSGSRALFFSNDYKSYGFSTFGGNVLTNKKIIICSDEKYICIDGPFYFKVDRFLKNKKSTLISKDVNNRVCTVIINSENLNKLLVKSFKCEYSNGAPTPRYRAVRVSPEGAIVDAVLDLTEMQ